MDRWRCLLLSVAMLVLLGMASCLLVALVGGNGSSGGSPTRGGLPITLCAGIATQPRYQVGIVWVSPVSSYLPPVAASDYSVCIRVPTGRTPTRLWDEWVFPP